MVCCENALATVSDIVKEEKHARRVTIAARPFALSRSYSLLHGQFLTLRGANHDSSIVPRILGLSIREAPHFRDSCCIILSYKPLL